MNQGNGSFRIASACPHCGESVDIDFSVRISCQAVSSGHTVGSRLLSDETRVQAMRWIQQYWEQELGGEIGWQNSPNHGHKCHSPNNPEPVIFLELDGGAAEKRKRPAEQRFGKAGGKDFCVLRCRDKARLNQAFGSAITGIIDDGKSGLHVTINWSNWKNSIKTILDWAWNRSED
jgi:hypothetical protein